MPTTSYPGLANHLRSWGLKVIEVSGWQTRSANWTRGFTPRAIVVHHTATPGTTGEYPTYNVILQGNGETPGPLAQLGLGRTGTVYVFCGHRANHAGTGGPLAGIPLDSANSYAWGIEAENNGYQAWPEIQLQAYYRLCAALCRYNGFPASSVIGHKEWAPTRKSDPHSLNMATFRTNVSRAIAAGPSGTVSPSIPGSVVPQTGGVTYSMAEISEAQFRQWVADSVQEAIANGTKARAALQVLPWLQKYGGTQQSMHDYVGTKLANIEQAVLKGGVDANAVAAAIAPTVAKAVVDALKASAPTQQITVEQVQSAVETGVRNVLGGLG